LKVGDRRWLLSRPADAKKIARFRGGVTRDYSGIGSKHYKASVEAASCAQGGTFKFYAVF
jgi:hypothetical protein